MAQWQRIRLPVQKMRVQSLDQEDPLEREVATLFQFSCLGKPVDGGASRATVHGVAKGQARQPKTTTVICALTARRQSLLNVSLSGTREVC